MHGITRPPFYVSKQAILPNTKPSANDATPPTVKLDLPASSGHLKT